MGVPEQELKNFNFSGGMNTELGLVNTDEKTAKNLENVELHPDGSVERRSGLALFEDDLMDSDPLNITYQTSQASWVYPAPSLYIWRTNEGNVVKDFMVVGGVWKDTAPTPAFYVKELVNGIADFEDFSTDPGDEVTNGAAYSNALFHANLKTRYTPLGNSLLMLHKQSSPGILLSPSAISVVPVQLKIRDADSVTPDDLVSNNAVAYRCIRYHTSSASNEPGTGVSSKEYWVRIGGAGSETAWATSTIYTSNVEDVFYALTGTTTVESDAPTHAAFVGGRVWYAGVAPAPATIFVTQPVSDERTSSVLDAECGHCFSVNDPLSAVDSSATAADGGTIQLREAGVIRSIVPFRKGLVIFASKGVWAITTAGNFDARNFEVLKIADVPIAGPDAYAVIDKGIIYFGQNSVQYITITDNGNMVTKEISQPIKTFYNSISEFSKEASLAVYNKLEQRVYFFTNFSDPEYITANGPLKTVNQNQQPCANQDILMLDLTLNAWYKYSIRAGQELADTDLMIADAATYIGDFGEEPMVINLAGDELQNAVFDDIYSSAYDGTKIQEFMIMLVTGKKTIALEADVFRYGFAHFKGDAVTDFENLPAADDVLKSEFNSEILSQHINGGDIAHKKQAPYITTIFRRVESGILDEEGNDITPGGCLLKFNWNWASGVKAGPKFGTAFAAYRPFRWNISPGDGSLPDIEVVLNKHKVRGRGNALQIGFTNDGNKRFHLLGYQMKVKATRKV